MAALSVIFGAIVGFSLGLSGGGGAIFAVPLLVYGLGVPPREAVVVSLVVVAMTASVGFVQRALRRTVEFPTAFLFGTAGMVAAPLGAALATLVPEWLLLLLLALLMGAIAARMWIKASGNDAAGVCIPTDDNARPRCRRDREGNLTLTSRCAGVLAFVGLATGILTGFFGVGGGFLIVPALITFSGMGIHRAVGTSLLVIALVSISGVVSHLLGGDEVPLSVTLPFLVGSQVGLLAGTALARRLAGPRLQRIFAVAIVGVAVFVAIRTLGS